MINHHLNINIHTAKSRIALRQTFLLAAMCCLASFAQSACFSSAPELQLATHREVLMVKNLKYDDVWMAVLRSMTKNLNIKHLDKSAGVIKAQLTDWGFTEYVQATVKSDPSASTAHRVEVISTRHRSAVMRDWEAFMLEDIRKIITKIPGYKEGVMRVVKEPL